VVIVSALNRKLLRDLRGQSGQAAAIALVLACGVAAFVMAVNTLGSLRRTQQAYYERYRFAHVFAHLKRAPDSLAVQVEDIPGVAQVQTRIVMPATLDVPGMVEPASARLISVPDRPTPMLNGLFLRKGRYVEAGNAGEVLVSEGFAQAHHLAPGDSVTAILNGRKQTLRVVGVALSPEYVYQLGPGQILPDDRRFGVFWMGHTDLAGVFDLKGAFNDLTLTLTPEGSEAEVIRRLDALTERYGGLGAYGRADQQSHEFLDNELNELRGMALVVPSIFLGVAAFLLNVVVSRTVGTQREQIAALKAFGYSRWEVTLHYLKFVGLIVLAGVAVGVAVGAWLGREITALYTAFFRFPVFDFVLDPAVVLVAVGLSAGAAVLGTFAAVRRAAALPPAEAMKPEPPATYSRTLLERVGLHRLLSPGMRMMVRHIERRKLKTALTAVGIAMAVAVVILGSFGKDAIDHVMVAQFGVAQRQDVTVGFAEPTSHAAVYELEHLPGVSRVEPIRAVAVRLRSAHRSRRVGLTGVPADAALLRVMDVHTNPVAVPADGLVLSEKLAELLEVRPGDALDVEVLEEDRPVRTAVVAGLVDDFAGTTAYMDLTAVNRLMREGAVVTGAHLLADPARRTELYAAVKNTPRVSGVVIKRDVVDSYQKTIGENILKMRLFNVLFAGAIAFGVVYNSARIALAERSRELATLRVLGFTRGEIARILLGELALLTLTAIPVGLACGYGLAFALIQAVYDTELFRLPLVISDWTYGFAASVTLAAGVVSGLVVGRRLGELDMVAVLKSRE
jgi:putative ABC transport system permease protein